jgi:hypothetical protein
MAELPGQTDQEKGDKGEDDVAADLGARGGAGRLRLPGGIRRGASRPDRVGLGDGQRLLLSCYSAVSRLGCCSSRSDKSGDRQYDARKRVSECVD